MQLSNMPDYRAHLSRHGHNLSHDFSFTSACGHLLTVFAQHMNPQEHIKGHIEMFSRTQPLNGCPNADIEEYVDYFFVPYDMFWMGFGENFFQTNEPFSAAITINDGSLPLYDFNYIENSLDTLSDPYPLKYSGLSAGEVPHIQRGVLDAYGLDCKFMSVYRNLFHNFINPNVLFRPVAVNMTGTTPALSDFQIPADFFQPNVFPAVLLAYNCVYQHFYRLDDRESFNASMYNIDKMLLDGDVMQDVFGSAHFSLKYRPLHFDYFTAGSVAPLINSTNIKGSPSNQSLLDINNYLSTYFNDKLNGFGLDGNSSAHTLGSGPNTGSVGFANASAIPSTSNLRSIFAVEKLLSVTNRAKKTYDAQVMAHFGVKVPKDVKHQIQFLGQQKGNIHIGEIISTADTVNGPNGTSLGDIAGKGYGNLGIKDIDFTAPCHGIVIGIYSCVPKLRYYVGTTKSWALTNRLDFYIPEYEHLGMQPIFRWEACQMPAGFSYGGLLNYNGSTKVVGWQMRYEQYKKQISRVSPAFAKTILGSTNRVDLDDRTPLYTNLNFNQWSNWVVSQRPFEPTIEAIRDSSTPLTLKDYLCPPGILNDLFVYQYPDCRFSVITGADSGTGGWLDLDSDFFKLDLSNTAVASRKSFAWNMASLFYYDPLLHFCDIKMKLISQMSDNTLPELAAV